MEQPRFDFYQLAGTNRSGRPRFVAGLMVGKAMVRSVSINSSYTAEQTLVALRKLKVSPIPPRPQNIVDRCPDILL